MKNNLRKLILPALVILLIGAASAFGQIKTGGYKTASVTDAGVKAAADFAVEQKSGELEQELSLEAILKAETQTVAGINYRLCLQINSASKDESEADVTEYVQAVIYRNLKGEYSLTSWEEADCAEK